MTLTTVNPALLDTQAQYTGFKNRIINGAMVIDQRNAGASVTAGSGYTLDRWNVDRVWSGATVTIQQSTTAPAGFSNSLLATVTTGAASASGSYFSVQQFIEGYNIADMAFGTASASQFTVSFKVRSSVIGTFGVCFRNSAFNLSYCTTYTVNAANTWEEKSVTIAAPTTGTWGTGNSYGINVIFSLGGGSSVKPASNSAWVSGSYLAPIGQTDLIATTGATWAVTGVQLEKGSTATSFDYRPYGTELGLCERYGELIESTTGNFAPIAAGAVITSISADATLPFRTKKRASPTIIYSAANTFALTNANGTNNTATSITTGRVDVNALVMSVGVASGLVAGNATRLMANNTANPTIFALSEL